MTVKFFRGDGSLPLGGGSSGGNRHARAIMPAVVCAKRSALEGGQVHHSTDREISGSVCICIDDVVAGRPIVYTVDP